MLGNGNILVANFSSPAGVYEYNSQGVQLGYYGIVGGLRGVYELPDQTIIVTNGREVFIRSVNDNELEINVSQFPAGIYILKAGEYEQKFVVK